MSLINRKHDAKDQVSVGLDRARQAATRVTPIAKKASAAAAANAAEARAAAAQTLLDARDRAVPKVSERVADAKDWAVPRVTQGVQDARDWAVPRVTQGVTDARDWAAPRIAQGVQEARTWAAPHIDHAAQAIQETVAPAVSGALNATARAVEPAAVTAKRRLWPRLLAGFVLAGALGGVVATILRKRNSQVDDLELDEEVPAEASADTGQTDDTLLADAEIGVNGQGHSA